MSGKFKKYIIEGKNEPMKNVPFHGEAPFKRLLMLDEKSVAGANAHIAVHQINNLPVRIPKYSELHKHDTDEVNLILSEDGELKYKIQFEDEVYQVVSPATIYIPKGIKHSAEVVSGKGTFVCIVFQAKYEASE